MFCWRKPNMQIRTEIEIYLCIIAFVVWSLDSSWFNLFVNKLGNVTSEQGIEINRKSFSREIFKWFFSHGIQIFLRELIVNISRQLILALLALILLPLSIPESVVHTGQTWWLQTIKSSGDSDQNHLAGYSLGEGRLLNSDGWVLYCK